MAGHGAQLSQSTYALAREEYSSAHAIFTSLLHLQPSTSTLYEVSRLERFERAAVEQRMRPYPLKMNALDAYVAAFGR